MVELTYENALKAMRAAHDAGRVDDAKKMAALAKQLQGQGSPERRGQMMSHVNRGIVNAAGGLVDMLNPFDQPHALNPFTNGTGSAIAGMENVAEKAGIDLAGEPETAWQAAQQGTGEAAASLVPVVKGLQGLRMAGGAFGQFADDALRSLLSIGGTTAEVTAGGVSRGAEKAAENAGAPEWVQNAAAVAAPLGVAAVKPTVSAVSKVMPGGMAVRKGYQTAKAAIAPYTEGGAYEVARNRMQTLAGGEERAARLAGRVDIDNRYGVSPAQQTDDEAMRGLERLAREQDPNLRERLDVRADQGRKAASADITGMGGDPADASAFYRQRLSEHTARLQAAADDVLKRAQRGVEGIGNQRSASQNSEAVMEEVGRALDDWLIEEKHLWDAVPMGVQIEPNATRATAERLVDETPWAQADDIPRVVRKVLELDGGQTSREMHGLYSKLRQISRSAMAGNDQNKNMARIADEMAEAVLADLGALSGDTRVGRAINDARAFSRSLHETFDRGVVGRLRKRTLDGDLSTDPALALRRSIGRQGEEAMVSAGQFQTATKGRSDPYVTDYIKERFSKAAVSAKGEFNSASARKFIRDNAELLDKYPELRSDIQDAVDASESADAFSKRISDRIASIENARTDARAAFLNGAQGQEVKAVFGQKNPVQAARRLAQEARKDTSGKALAGLKGAFSDHLTSGGVDNLAETLTDPNINAALRQVYSPAEMTRLKLIARNMEIAAKTQAAEVGGTLSGAKPSRVIEYLVRVVAARHGAELGGSGGGSLQTAQMASSRAKEILGKLVSDKASQIISDAIEDPELFRALLTDTKTQAFEKRAVPRLVPYLVGTTAAQTLE